MGDKMGNFYIFSLPFYFLPALTLPGRIEYILEKVGNNGTFFSHVENLDRDDQVGK